VKITKRQLRVLIRESLVENEMLEPGAAMVDTSKPPPPAAAALVKATAGIPGVKVGKTSEYGVTVSWELEGVTGAGARAQVKKLLQPNGFSRFNPGRYMGGGMAGFRGGPQKTLSATYDQGGRIFADFSTWTSFGEKTTMIKIRAEWSHNERSGS
jgi:hypothetical protein